MIISVIGFPENAFIPIVVMFEDISKFVILFSENALSPIVVTLDGIWRLAIWLLLNPLIVWTPFGIVISVNWFPWNPDKFFNWLDFPSLFSITSFDIWLFPKAESSIAWTLAGISTSVNWFSLNALPPMLLKWLSVSSVSSNITFFKLLLANALSAISTTYL